jgi:hypothetical protein
MRLRRAIVVLALILAFAGVGALGGHAVRSLSNLFGLDGGIMPSMGRLSKSDEQDPEREDFVRLVRENAQDPSELEIITWGEKEATYGDRRVRFRCKLIGFTGSFWMGGPRGPTVYQRGGDPVSVDDAAISYWPDGKIKEARLESASGRWQANWNRP